MARMPMPAVPVAMAEDPAMMADPAMIDETELIDETEMVEGYVIEIIVKADGSFAVSKEELRAEAEEGPGEEAMSYDSLGQAMKAVMDIVKQNPVGESEQSQFDAGYAA